MEYGGKLLNWKGGSCPATDKTAVSGKLVAASDITKGCLSIQAEQMLCLDKLPFLE